MAKVHLPLSRARKIADDLMRRLGEGCERITLAGSMRRESPIVGDIELIAIPRRDTDLLQREGDSLLGPYIQALIEEGTLEHPVKNGEKYKQIPIRRPRGLMLDLFLVTPETWGVQWALRTGPPVFSKALVTQRSHGGLLPDDCKIDQGRMWRRIPPRGGAPGSWECLNTPEELDFLQLCDAVVHPRQRGPAALAMIRRGEWLPPTPVVAGAPEEGER